MTTPGGEKRAWTGPLLRQAYPGIFEIGDGFLIECGVRYRITAYDRDRDIWYGVLNV